MSAMTTTTPSSTGFRRTSTRTWLGLPLYDIRFEQDPTNPRMPAIAKGVVAVGGRARGIIAAGIEARGVLSFGVVSIGVISVGVAAGGLLAVAPFAFGVSAIGVVVGGVQAFGWKVWKVLFSVGT